jgi:uncharacterized glyoxalase superfamily protein PhnB
MPQFSPVFTPTVVYRDPLAALDWLEQAFGFETVTKIVDSEGRAAHLEMAFRDAVVGICGEWEAPMLGTARMRSPKSTEALATQFLWVSLERDIDGHCARARKAGAVITQEPADQFYGARTYRAQDPEGHVWCFSETKRAVSEEEMRKAAPELVWKDPKEKGQ